MSSPQISELPFRDQMPVPVVPQFLDPQKLLLWQFQQTKLLGDPVRGNAMPFSELPPDQVVMGQLSMKFLIEVI